MSLHLTYPFSKRPTVLRVHCSRHPSGGSSRSINQRYTLLTPSSEIRRKWRARKCSCAKTAKTLAATRSEKNSLLTASADKAAEPSSTKHRTASVPRNRLRLANVYKRCTCATIELRGSGGVSDCCGQWVSAHWRISSVKNLRGSVSMFFWPSIMRSWRGEARNVHYFLQKFHINLHHRVNIFLWTDIFFLLWHGMAPYNARRVPRHGFSVQHDHIRELGIIRGTELPRIECRIFFQTLWSRQKKRDSQSWEMFLETMSLL